MSKPSAPQGRSRTATITLTKSGGIGIAMRLLIVLTAWFLTSTAVRAANGFIEERGYIRVKIGGQTYRLEALIVRRDDLHGRLPIAYYNHSRPGNHFSALEQGFEKESLFIVHDLARRGWLGVAINRRGFGRSDGALQADNHTGCDVSKHKTFLEADADDMHAAIDIISRRPDADPSRMISIGASAGGGASIALGARNPQGLLAAINIGGGYAKGFINGKVQCNTEQSIQNDFREIGSRSRVDNIWMFAENDPLHPPSEVEMMRASFAAGGGKVRVINLGMLGDDGHKNLNHILGRRKWLAELDRILRSYQLPTWTKADVDALMQRFRISESNRAFTESYLGSPSEVALAQSLQNRMLAYSFGATPADARKSALERCEAKAPPCRIIMENHKPVEER